MPFYVNLSGKCSPILDFQGASASLLAHRRGGPCGRPFYDRNHTPAGNMPLTFLGEFNHEFDECSGYRPLTAAHSGGDVEGKSIPP